MGTVSFTEAAALAGWKSRSTLYRLKASGDLDAYLTPGPRGDRLMVAPDGRPPLREFLADAVRQQAGSPLRASRPAPVDPVVVAHRERDRANARADAIRQRELALVDSLDELKNYISGRFAMDLMRGLADPAPIGDVMVPARQLALDHMHELDRCWLNSKCPRD